MLYPRQAAYGAVGAVLLLWFFFWGTPTIDSRQALSLLEQLDRTIMGSPTPDSRRILILQHLPRNKTFLERASHLSHKIYAHAWGYTYSEVPFEYTQIQMLDHSFNRQFALRGAIERELKKDDRAEWILYAGADTMVVNPAVPLHALLPPEDLSPVPHLLGPRDAFSAETLLVRVSNTTLAIVSDTIAAGKDARNPFPTEHDKRTPDQHFFQALLRSNATYAESFYEIPQAWLGAAAAADADPWVPQLHLRLNVNEPYRAFAAASRNVYRSAEALARAGGDSFGSGLALMAEQGLTTAQARDWWYVAKAGIKNLRFVEHKAESA